MPGVDGGRVDSSPVASLWPEPTPSWHAELLHCAREAGEDIGSALRLAERFGHQLPQPGAGRTALRWRALADVAAADLTAARVLEAHTDALAILTEAGQVAAAGTWGVFAAEAPGARLDAVSERDAWTITGIKPWCSLATRLDNALVTAHVPGGRQLFAVNLRQDNVLAEPPSVWVARGLRNVPSGPVHFAGTPAHPVGAVGWYLSRSGFAWGGLGVAACWFGGACALAGALLAKGRFDAPTDVLALQLGRVDAVLHASAATLLDAAARVDRGAADATDGALLALRVRAIDADAAEQTLVQVGHALGPAPLAFDEMYARRSADLTLYVRQHHGERDLAALGALLIKGGSR